MKYLHKIHSRSKSLKISVEKDGSVVVTTPRFTPELVIQRFLNDHINWIEKQQKKILEIKKTIPSEDSVLLFGKVYELRIETDLKKKIGVERIGNKLHITPVEQTKTSIKKSLDRFLRKLAISYIEKKTEQIAAKMKTTYKNVAFKTQKTRWGSCSSLGNLNFNWRLVHAPPQVIDYVIIHELAHRTHMNHSDRFWALVAKYDANHKQHRSWLKKYGSGIQEG